jgi:hypothetical protein
VVCRSEFGAIPKLVDERAKNDELLRPSAEAAAFLRPNIHHAVYIRIGEHSIKAIVAEWPTDERFREILRAVGKADIGQRWNGCSGWKPACPLLSTNWPKQTPRRTIKRSIHPHKGKFLMRGFM